MTPRILHLIHTPRHSGAEALVSDLCVRHRACGMHVAVSSFEPIDPDYLTAVEMLRNEGIRLIAPEAKLSRLGRAAHFRKACLDFLPDVIFAHSVLPSFYGRVAASFLSSRPKFVTVLHDASNDDFADPSLRLFEKATRGLTDFVVAVSNIGMLNYRARFGSWPPARTIKNGIDLGRFAHIDRASARSAYSVRDTKLLLQVGRIAPVKQQIISVELLNSLRKEGIDAQLWLAGLTEDPTYERELRERIRQQEMDDHVRFLGSRQDVPDLLAAADLYLMPSLKEAHSVAFLEALASGVPILASEIDAFQFAEGMDKVAIVKIPGPSVITSAKELLSSSHKTERPLAEFDVVHTANAYLGLARELADVSA